MQSGSTKVLSLAAIDMFARTRVLLLNGALEAAVPKKLRYQLRRVVARLTRGGRRLRMRISATWPWRHEVAFSPSAARCPRHPDSGLRLPTSHELSRQGFPARGQYR